MNDRKIAFGIVLTSILVILFICNLSLKSEQIIDYSVFLNEVRNNRVSEVVIASFIIQGERNDGTKFRSVRPNIQDPPNLWMTWLTITSTLLAKSANSRACFRNCWLQQFL